MRSDRSLVVRWTIGDVSPYGFEALRLSIWGAWKVFGREASYAVCVNTVPVGAARELTGYVPEAIAWYNVSEALPEFLAEHVDTSMAEGVAWKLAPLRMFPDQFELVLDNDCIIWNAPEAFQQWCNAANCRRCILAEDVVAMFGKFSGMAGDAPRNCGIRGFPPGFDLEEALRNVLSANPATMTSELDGLGLQAAAMSMDSEPLVVSLEEVTICSPFPPHMSYLGQCGAHFCGLNAKTLPWSLNGRPAVEYIRTHWRRHRSAIYDKVMPGKVLQER